MPHQCVRCSTIYDDGAKEIIEGCECGAKLFLYVRQEKLDEAKEIVQDLSDDDKEQIEEDVLNIVGAEKSEPVVLDLESIRVLKPGQFELDLTSLFNKEKALVFKLSEGKYVVDLAESFKKAE